jgi:hypothetical protein
MICGCMARTFATAGFIAAVLIGLSQRVEADPPPKGKVAYTQSGDWVLTPRREVFTARMPFTGNDGTSAVLTVSCSTERGTVSYTRQEFIDQPPTPVTMEIIAGGATLLAEEATADVAGYATDLVRRSDFLSAMQTLQGATELRMDILGATGRIELSFILGNDSGFRQALRRCSEIME